MLYYNRIDITQPARNIPGTFAEFSLSVAKFRAFSEHLGIILEENIFKNIFDGKVYDLTITNVDVLANSSNHKSVFPELSKNIPQIFVSKIFHGCPWNIVKLWKYFYEVKKFKKLFCGLSSGIFNIGSLLFWNIFLKIIETVFHLE